MCQTQVYQGQGQVIYLTTFVDVITCACPWYLHPAHKSMNTFSPQTPRPDVRSRQCEPCSPRRLVPSQSLQMIARKRGHLRARAHSGTNMKENQVETYYIYIINIVPQAWYLVSSSMNFWRCPESNSQISQCTCLISDNTLFRTEMCTFLFWTVPCRKWDQEWPVIWTNDGPWRLHVPNRSETKTDLCQDMD